MLKNEFKIIEGNREIELVGIEIKDKKYQNLNKNNSSDKNNENSNNKIENQKKDLQKSKLVFPKKKEVDIISNLEMILQIKKIILMKFLIKRTIKFKMIIQKKK